QFVRYNFFAPSGFFKTRVTPYNDLRQLIIQNPYLALLGGAGLVRFLLSIFRRDSFGNKDFILFSSTVGVIGGVLFLMPIPHTQVYLMFLPLIALFAGAFLIESVDKLMELRKQLPVWQWSLMIVLIALAVMTSLGLMRLGTELHWRSFIV